MEEEEDEQGQVAKGFDRDIDYEPMKKKLIDEYHKLEGRLENLDIGDIAYVAKRRILIHKLIYLTIALIQLTNGARIIEAVKAFRLLINSEDLAKRVTVKIAKSESAAKKRKARYREMKFPSKSMELSPKMIEDMKFHVEAIKNDRLKQRVLDYLLQYFQCNTHSLRYACINYLIYVQKRPLNDVAKFVGHTDLQQLTRYTQQKNANQIFDLDI